MQVIKLCYKEKPGVGKTDCEQRHLLGKDRKGEMLTPVAWSTLPAVCWDGDRARGGGSGRGAIGISGRALTRGRAMMVHGPLYLTSPRLKGVGPEALGGLQSHGLGHWHARPGIACIQANLTQVSDKLHCCGVNMSHQGVCCMEGVSKPQQWCGKITQDHASTKAYLDPGLQYCLSTLHWL